MSIILRLLGPPPRRGRVGWGWSSRPAVRAESPPLPFPSPSREGFMMKWGLPARASSGERELIANEPVELRGRGGDGLGDGFGTEAELFGADEGDVVQPHEAEHGPQMRLLAVHRRGGAAAVEAAAGLDDDRLLALD